jgi:threonine/homoserine/homoserine lactone efflux protein
MQTIVLFMGTALALNLTPGPAILFILSRCLGEGRADAIVSVFGLATASIIHTLAAAFGYQPCFRIRQWHSAS